VKNFMEFLKRHWFFVSVIFLIALFLIAGVPLLINLAFTKPAPCKLLAVDWEAKDALSYYGSALGFLGTVIFSGLALWQNHIIQQANDKHTALLEQMEVIKNEPHIVAVPTSANGHASNLKMLIKNTSENIAEKLTASNFAIIDEQGETIWKNEETISLDYLTNERKWEISWENPIVTSLNHQFIFDLRYSDKFGGLHSCKVIGSFYETIGLPRFKLTELQ